MTDAFRVAPMLLFANGTEPLVVAQEVGFGLQGWIFIIAAIFAGLGGMITPIVVLIITHRREKAKADREDAKEREKLDRDLRREIALAEAVERVRVDAVDAADRVRSETVAAAREVKAQVKEVKQTLQNTMATQDQRADVHEQTLAEIIKVGTLTHDLVNSASLVQLRLYAVASRRIAELTNDPVDIEAAGIAERLFHEHEEKQAKAVNRFAAGRDGPNGGES